jgi:hypothetical protein
MFTSGNSGYTFAGSVGDQSLDLVKKQLMILQEMYTSNGPVNLFKMPIYQYCADPREVNKENVARMNMIQAPDHIRVFNLCNQFNPNPKEYSTDIYYGLDSVEKRQKEGKDRYDKFVQFMGTVQTELKDIESKLDSTVNTKVKKLRQQSNRLMSQVLNCYGLMHALSLASNHQIERNNNLEQEISAKLISADRDLSETEAKLQEFAQDGKERMDDDRLLLKSSQEIESLFALDKPLDKNKLLGGREEPRRQDAKLFYETMSNMKDVLSKLQDDVNASSRDLAQIEAYVQDHNPRGSRWGIN